MKVLSFFVMATLLALNVKAQSYAVQWGDEMKLKKGSLDFDVVNADETGVYVLEGKMRMTAYYIVGASFKEEHKLIKFDKSYNQVYSQEYRKLLKGLSFKSIQFLQKDMYLFATDYDKKEKRYTVYGVRLDRNTGEPMGEMKELANYDLESKKDEFQYSLTPSPDSTRWMLAGDISTETNTVIAVTMLDKQLVSKGSTRINLSYDKKAFTLEDLIPTNEGKFLVIGRQFEMVPTGKKNRTIRTFTKYVFSKYDARGKKEMDLPTDVSSHYVTNAKILYSPNGELALAGFYSNDPKKKEVNGFFLHKVDVNTGTVTHSSFKEISANMLDQAQLDESDQDEVKKKDKKDKDKQKAQDNDGDEDGISSDFVIRGVEYNPVNHSLLLIAELSKFATHTYTTSSYNSVSKSWTYTTRVDYVFTNSDLLVINTNANGQIDWINTLPKKQVETISDENSHGGGLYISSGITGFFARAGGMPFYSSFSYMLRDNKVVFLINDHEKNIEVNKLGDKVKSITNFKKSVAYAVSLDLTTGQFSRKLLLSNEDDPVLMPRFAYVVGKDFFLPAMKMKALGKTEFKIGKITVKS